MVLYFSATGNSRWVARKLADIFGLSCRSVSPADESALQAKVFLPNEPLFLVFPIHSWGPAAPMFDFIRQMSLDGYEGQSVYAVCVCGDDCGRTDRIVAKQLRRRGVVLTSAFSVQMPNNYILLPGFDVDSPAVEREKLSAASARVQEIADAVRKGGGAQALFLREMARVEECALPDVCKVCPFAESVLCNRCLHQLRQVYPALPGRSDNRRYDRSAAMAEERVRAVSRLHTSLPLQGHRVWPHIGTEGALSSPRLPLTGFLLR